MIFDSANNIYIADSNNNRIRLATVITPPTAPILTLEKADATALTISWTGGSGPKMGGGHTYTITPSTGITLPINQTSPVIFSGLTPATQYTITVKATNGANTTGVTSAPLIATTAPTVPITVSTYAGSSAGSTNGAAAAALFSAPTGVTIDVKNNLYIADKTNNAIRMINNAGTVSTIPSANLSAPSGITVDPAGTTLYVSDTGNNKIVKFTLAGTTWTQAAFAGSGTVGSANGTSLATATFNAPCGLALNPTGQILYIADKTNHVVRQINISTSTVSTFAGTPGTSGSLTGVPAENAQFSSPQDLTVDSNGVVYVVDTGNNKIRVISGICVRFAPHSKNKQIRICKYSCRHYNNG